MRYQILVRLVVKGGVTQRIAGRKIKAKIVMININEI
jgi:hypothetical protein